jgi:predicted RNA-binding Zn-ribbon protein involved in translation (DUF1610 family)
MKKYTKEELQKLISESVTFREVIIKSGRSESSMSHKTLKRHIKKWEIDTSHFLNHSDFMKKMFSEDKLLRRSDEEVFCENSSVARASVKKRLIKNKIFKYECKECGQGEMWRGKKISLILDHENGINNDNRLENLRFLCPNCNSTLETHCLGKVGVDKKNAKKNTTKEKREYVPRFNFRKVKNRPSKEELKKMIETNSYCALGRKFSVSDNTIRDWAKQYQLL